MKRYGFKREEGFAQLTHGPDIILETLRGRHRSQLTRAINKNRRASDWLPKYAGDKSGRVNSGRADADCAGLARDSRVANIDVVISCGEIGTGESAQCDVVPASCEIKTGPKTHCNVVPAGCVTSEAKRTVCRVLVAGCVAYQSRTSVGRVAIAGCVVKERLKTDCRVVAVDGVQERIITQERVLKTELTALLANGSRLRRRSATGRTRCGELSAHLLDLSCLLLNHCCEGRHSRF